MITHPQTPASIERQQLLMNSLMEMLQTAPYSQITVTDICRTAAIPRRTFYHYFESKDALLSTLIENILRQCSLHVMFDFDGGYEVLLEGLVRNFKYWQNEGQSAMSVLLDNNLEGMLVSVALRWLQTERLAFFNIPGLSPKQIEIISMACIASFFSILHYWRKNNFQESPEEIAEYTAYFLAKPLFHP